MGIECSKFFGVRPCLEIPMKTLLRLGSVSLLLVALMGSASCQKSDPLQIKVSAATVDAFRGWRIRVGSDLSPADWLAFDDAMQEIKLQVMAAREASGGAAVDEAARNKIQGRTVRDVLQAGWEGKLRRLGAERSELLVAIEQNSRLTIKPGDTESANYLARARQRQAEHLQRLVDDIAATEQKLKLLAKPAASRPS